MTSFSSRDEGDEGWPPGVFMQGYDSMEVNRQYRAKDIILKKLGSFWRKADHALWEIGRAKRGRIMVWH